MTASPVEVHQHIVVGGDVYTGNLILIADIWNALRAVLVEGIEGQFLNLQRFPAVFHLLDTLIDSRLDFLIGVCGTALCCCFNEELLMQSIPLGGTIPIEPDKIGFIVFSNDLLDKTVFRLAHFAVTAFPDEHDKVFQEPDFLHVQLLSLDAERIHGDRICFGVTNVLATDIFA